MTLDKDTEVKFKELNETLDYILEMIAELGPANGHLRLAASFIKKIKRVLENWKKQ